MADKRIDENPTISDRLVIDLECPDANGCFTSDPYKLDKAIIYYVQRNYSIGNFTQFDKTSYDATIQAELTEARKTYCDDPTEENLADVEKLETQLDASKKTETFYYSEAKPVAVYGNADLPAWLSTDIENALVAHIEIDDEDNTIYGQFELIWNPLGMREGDYFVCWTWSPNPSGDKLSAQKYFTLGGDTQLTTSIPTHFTNPIKYETLLERYLPDMFKIRISEADLSPLVFQEFNAAVAKGFTALEDMANQIVDLVDANATHESLLPVLSNLFAWKLRTSDPTLWRRQIKQAIPLYKKKGTYEGLEAALSESAIRLAKFTRLWQVLSQYTHQEAFVVEVDGQTEFILSQTAILPVDLDNFELYFQAEGDDEWEELSSDDITLETTSGVTTMTWLNDELVVGDKLRVIYQIAEVEDEDAQEIETYIRTLPLEDQRDEDDQTYPLKNWNVRVIEEDDPLFDSVIPNKHPFYDPIIYGKIRTEFPYSENIYNMEEYNGSIRDSENPCHIDKDFLDVCASCQSSKFNIDLEIEKLTDDRIAEAYEIIKDFVPFHATIHSMNLTGVLNEFIPPPVERIQLLATVRGEEFTVSGTAQTIFSRSMTSPSQFKRNELANITTAVSDGEGDAFNEHIALFSPTIRLNDSGVDTDPDYNFLEVLTPSANAGSYSLVETFRNHATVDGSFSEPIDQSAFTYNLYNERATKSSTTIVQDDLFTFYDAEDDLSTYDIKTLWDVENTDYSGDPWTVTISAYSDTYEVLNYSDGVLSLADPDKTLPTSNTSGITYILKDADGETILSSAVGILRVARRARVDFSGTVSLRGDSVTLDSIQSLMDSYHGHGARHYLLYDSNYYPFGGFVAASNTQFYILDYSDGDVSGVVVKLYEKLVNRAKGYFNYKGIKLVTDDNYEVDLEIQNGENADTLYPAVDSHGDDYTLQVENSKFKENFLILLDGNYYAISAIDGNEIWLAGPDVDWKTTGTPVTFDIFKHEKLGGSVPERTYPPMQGYEFDMIDRRGSDIIQETLETGMSMMALSTALNQDKPTEVVQQKESISFKVKMKDGTEYEGKIT